MPCFNAAPFIGSAIKSVLCQTWQDFELIVVDDGSTDGSIDAISNIKDQRILILQSPKKGAAAARNLGFAASKGSFILYLDSDDVINRVHLEAMASQLIGCDTCVALSRWDRFRVSPEEAKFPDRPTETNLRGADWLKLSWSDTRPMMQCGMILIPRSLIETFGGWDERLTLIDDFEFFARILAQVEEVRFAPEARLYYRSAISGSLSQQKSRKAIESQLLSLQLGTGHLLAVRDDDDTRRVCAGLFQDFYYSHYPYDRDLRQLARNRVIELGGSSIEPDGPPGFHKLRRWIGWRLARRVQFFAEANGLNASGRKTMKAK